MPRFSNPVATVTLLIAVIVAQGVLVSIPHDHGRAPVSPAPCDHSVGNPAPSSHLGRDAVIGPAAPCLACAAQGLAFSITPSPSLEFSIEPADRFASRDEIINRLPRRWHSPLRGPPPSI
jgi:hypothetical protein